MDTNELFKHSPVIGPGQADLERERLRGLFPEINDPYLEACFRIKMALINGRARETTAHKSQQPQIKAENSKEIRDLLGELSDDVLSRITNPEGDNAEGLSPLAVLRQSVLPL